MRNREQHQNCNNKKAAGPERPASAAGIGPFRLRYASRALRASGLLETKENEHAIDRK
jgi:hypothetical protein